MDPRVQQVAGSIYWQAVNTYLSQPSVRSLSLRSQSVGEEIAQVAHDIGGDLLQAWGLGGLKRYFGDVWRDLGVDVTD